MAPITFLTYFAIVGSSEAEECLFASPALLLGLPQGYSLRHRCRTKTRPSVQGRYPMPGRKAIGALELARHMALVGKACVQRGFREAEA